MEGQAERLYGKSRCLGCMTEMGPVETCPHCGWVNSTTHDSPLRLVPGTLLNGQYLIGRVLGHGGFGITYLAWDLNLNVKLAIKEYLPSSLVTRYSGNPQVIVYSGEA